MRIRRIINATFLVDSISRVRAFYVDHLGLPFRLEREGLLAVFTGETHLELLVAPSGSEGLIGRNTGVTFRCRGDGDLGRLIRRIRPHVSVTDEDFGPFRGGHRLLVKDACGNRFALWECHDHRGDLNIVEGPSSAAVRVRDVRQALDFYNGLLEMPVADIPDPKAVVLFNDSMNLILTPDASWSPCPPVSGETGLFFYVEDIQTLAHDLTQRGVRFVEPPRSTGAVTVASIRDPDGNILNLIGRIE